jgi:uncharacterized protein YggE
MNNMNRILAVAGVLALASGTLNAQLFGGRAKVSAAGTGTVTIKPDLLQLSVGVVTQGNTAQEASDANSTLANTVVNALQQLVGSAGQIKTTNYSLAPNYKYPAGGGTPTLMGYTATNTVQVSTPDLSLGGRIIDTATKAGANSISALTFTLKDPEPARREALRLATIQAKAHADAIATGLGLQVGGIITAAESSNVRPVTANVAASAGAAATTPIETGNLEISAYVTIEAELVGS